MAGTGELRAGADRSQPLQGPPSYAAWLPAPSAGKVTQLMFAFKTEQITLNDGTSRKKAAGILPLVSTVNTAICCMLYLQDIKINPLRASTTCLDLLLSAMLDVDSLGQKMHFYISIN